MQQHATFVLKDSQESWQKLLKNYTPLQFC